MPLHERREGSGDGDVTEVRARMTLNAQRQSARWAQGEGTIHGCRGHAIEAEVRLYDTLFTLEIDDLPDGPTSPPA